MKRHHLFAHRSCQHYSRTRELTSEFCWLESSFRRIIEIFYPLYVAAFCNYNPHFVAPITRSLIPTNFWSNSNNQNVYLEFVPQQREQFHKSHACKRLKPKLQSLPDLDVRFDEHIKISHLTFTGWHKRTIVSLPQITHTRHDSDAPSESSQRQMSHKTFQDDPTTKRA